MKKGFEYLFGGVGVVIALAIGVAIGNEVIFIILALLFCIIGLILGNYVVNKKISRRSEFIVFDKSNDSAKLYIRSSNSAANIRYEAIQNVYTKYNPAQVTYTSVTVGGVTTGGFDTTKPYYSEHGQGASGRYHLFAKLEDGSIVTLKDIHLTPELVGEAKKNPNISKFLKDDCLHLLYETPDTKLTKAEKDILANAISNGDIATQENITQRAFIATQLTKDDCVAIKNWIAGI